MRWFPLLFLLLLPLALAQTSTEQSVPEPFHSSSETPADPTTTKKPELEKLPFLPSSEAPAAGPELKLIFPSSTEIPALPDPEEPELELILPFRDDETPTADEPDPFDLLPGQKEPEEPDPIHPKRGDGDSEQDPNLSYFSNYTSTPFSILTLLRSGAVHPLQSGKVNAPRRLHPFKNMQPQVQFEKKYWPPRKEVGGALDLDQTQEGYKEWQDTFDKQQEAYRTHDEALKKAEEAAKLGPGYKGPARPYPYCVTGLKPLYLISKENQDATFTGADGVTYKRDYYNPKSPLMDHDLYHFMMLFEMSQPLSGEPAVSDNLDGRAPGKDIQHYNSDGIDEGPYITRIDKYYVDSPPPGIVQRSTAPGVPIEGGMGYTGEGGDKVHTKHLPNWMHIVVRSRVKLEGLYLQAIAFPSGLPFGRFVDDFECEGPSREGGSESALSMDCTKNPDQYTWREGTPENSRRVKTIHYCRYGHGSNDADMYPTVYAFGGQRYLTPGPKFDTFRTLFTWTSVHCNYKMRWQLLVLAVRSFINAEFEAFLTSNVVLGETRKSSTTPPLIEDWKGHLKCNRPIGQASNPDPIEYGLKTRDPLNEEAGMSPGVMEVFLTASSTIPIPYSKEYDDCVQDPYNEKKLLDNHWNCPPKALCLNLEQPFESWDKNSNLKAFMKETKFNREYHNHLSFQRFPRFFQRHYADREDVWEKMKSCVVGKAKRCRPPEETIPHAKPEERSKGNALPLPPSCANNNKGRQLPSGSGGGIEQDESSFFQKRGGHKFNDKLYRGFYRNYFQFSKKSRITHIWTMTLAWFVLLFVGIYTARYYKETGGINPDTGNSWQGLGYWFWFHVILLLLSMTFMWIGISEAISIRRKPPSCNMFQSFPDLSLKLFCRWRKQNVRLHQQLGITALALFHVALIFAWSRPVRLWNSINLRKVFLFLHISAAYLGKIFCFVCVVVLFLDRGNKAICPDIPTLIVITEFVGLLFLAIGWILQCMEDRVEGRVGRAQFPVIEAIEGGVDASKKCYLIKVLVVLFAVMVHLLLLAFVAMTLRAVYWKDNPEDNKEGTFEDRHGFMGKNNSCSVPSQETVMKALYLKYFKDRQDI